MKLGDTMKKVSLILLLILLGITYLNRDTIVLYVVQKILFKGTTNLEINEYHKNDDFELAQNTINLTPSSNNDFNNIFYTILNSGMNEVVIYCSSDYKNCINDFNDYTKNSSEIEAINNYVDPFNSFKNIAVSTDNFNRIQINITKAYTENQIELIDSMINKYIKENINSSMNDREKIRAFHDYIINNTKYDMNYNVDVNKDTYPNSPYNAYGVLFENKAICGGYSDVMAIYLDKIGIKNYRIASSEHIWNYVFVDNNWYHLDLTWDDPITNTGEDILIYDFFLIDNKQLESKKTSQHQYNKNLYLEAK